MNPSVLAKHFAGNFLRISPDLLPKTTIKDNNYSLLSNIDDRLNFFLKFFTFLDDKVYKGRLSTINDRVNVHNEVGVS